MMFPPVSGRKAVRMRNATTISGLSRVYSTLMAAWITHDAVDPVDDQAGVAGPRDPEKAGEKRVDLTPWLSPVRQQLLGITLQVQLLRQQTQIARWEGSVRGSWAHEEYARLAEVQYEMTACLSQVSADARFAWLCW